MNPHRLAFTALALSHAAGCGSTDAERAREREAECPATERRGAIDLTVYQGDTWNGVDVTAAFQRSPEPRAAIRCTRSVVGPCAVTECSNVGVDFVSEPSSCWSANPGLLTVTRPDGTPLRVQGTARVTLPRAFAPGEALAMESAGAEVPAFMASIRVPQRGRVLTPTGLTNGSGLTLGRDEALAVTWEPTTSLVMVTATTNNGGERTAECVFDGATGAGTVPAAAMPSDNGALEVSTLERVTFAAGPYPVTARVRWSTGARTLYGRAP